MEPPAYMTAWPQAMEAGNVSPWHCKDGDTQDLDALFAAASSSDTHHPDAAFLGLDLTGGLLLQNAPDELPLQRESSSQQGLLPRCSSLLDGFPFEQCMQESPGAAPPAGLAARSSSIPPDEAPRATLEHFTPLHSGSETAGAHAATPPEGASVLAPAQAQGAPDLPNHAASQVMEENLLDFGAMEELLLSEPGTQAFLQHAMTTGIGDGSQGPCASAEGMGGFVRGVSVGAEPDKRRGSTGDGTGGGGGEGGSEGGVGESTSVLSSPGTLFPSSSNSANGSSSWLPSPEESFGPWSCGQTQEWGAHGQGAQHRVGDDRGPGWLSPSAALAVDQQYQAQRAQVLEWGSQGEGAQYRVVEDSCPVWLSSSGTPAGDQQDHTHQAQAQGRGPQDDGFPHKAGHEEGPVWFPSFGIGVETQPGSGGHGNALHPNALGPSSEPCRSAQELAAGTQAPRDGKPDKPHLLQATGEALGVPLGRRMPSLSLRLARIIDDIGSKAKAHEASEGGQELGPGSLWGHSVNRTHDSSNGTDGGTPLASGRSVAQALREAASAALSARSKKRVGTETSVVKAGGTPAHPRETNAHRAPCQPGPTDPGNRKRVHGALSAAAAAPRSSQGGASVQTLPGPAVTALPRACSATVVDQSAFPREPQQGVKRVGRPTGKTVVHASPAEACALRMDAHQSGAEEGGPVRSESGRVSADDSGGDEPALPTAGGADDSALVTTGRGSLEPVPPHLGRFYLTTMWSVPGSSINVLGESGSVYVRAMLITSIRKKGGLQHFQRFLQLPRGFSVRARMGRDQALFHGLEPSPGSSWRVHGGFAAESPGSEYGGSASASTSDRGVPLGGRGYSESALKETLLALATAIATHNHAQARELEAELCAFADPAGAGPQRFCHHVLAALSKRTGTIFPHSLLDLPSSSPFLGNVSVPEGSDEQRQLVQAMVESKLGYFSAAPIVRFFFSTTSAVVMRCIGTRKRVHIINFNVILGAQWIAVLLDLGKRECGPPKSVRITSIVCPCTTKMYKAVSRNCGRDMVAQLTRDLQRAAKTAGIKHFEHATARMAPHHLEELWKVEGRRYGGGMRGMGAQGEGGVGMGGEREWGWHEGEEDEEEDSEEEVLVVNGCVDLECLPDSGVIRANPRDTVLAWIRSMQPDVFLAGGHDFDSMNPFFLSRFRACLDYYSTIFLFHDDAVMPVAPEGLLFEAVFWGKNMRNVIACEGLSRIVRAEREDQWRARLVRQGFRSNREGMDAALQDAVYEAIKVSGESFGMVVGEGAVKLLWKGRSICFVSIWET